VPLAHVQVLRKNGRLLLLEHGRSTWSFINNILDGDAAHRYEIWGCWWNRDIVSILEEAGLEVETLSRWHFGTTLYVIAKAGCTDAEAAAPLIA
jgi:methyltransferase OMS1, mitochondrial